MWDGVGVESKIESVGEVCETEWPNVLKVSDANAIRSCGVTSVTIIVTTPSLSPADVYRKGVHRKDEQSRQTPLIQIR